MDILDAQAGHEVEEPLVEKAHEDSAVTVRALQDGRGRRQHDLA